MTENHDTPDDSTYLPKDNHHFQFTIELMCTEGGRVFFEQLHRGLGKFFKEVPLPDTEGDTVNWFTSRPADQVRSLFFAVREALELLAKTGLSKEHRRAAEKAAAALYCIAACRSIDTEAHNTHCNDNKTTHLLIESPNREPLTCAIIITALFGGKLELVSSDTLDHNTGIYLPKPLHAYKLDAPSAGDHAMQALERTVFNQIVGGNRATDCENSLDNKPLSTDEHSDLTTQIEEIQVRQNHSLTLIINTNLQTLTCLEFAEKYRVPVVVENCNTTHILTGMNASTLQSHIKLFWKLVQEICTTPSSGDDSSPKGAPAMSGTGNTYNNYHAHNMAVNHGDHSAAQAGDKNTAIIGREQQFEFSKIPPLLDELQQTVGELSSEKARDGLGKQIATIKTEVAKNEKADPGIIRKAIETLKSGSEFLDGGEKVFEKSKKIYNMLAPIFGFPPLP